MTDLPENSPSPTLKFPNWLRNTLLFPLVFLNIWLLTISIDYLQPLLSIVLVSIILAIVLDFPIKFLQGQGMPRSLSLTLVLLLGIGLVTLLGLLIVPALIQQVRDFIDLLPQWVASADALFEWFDNSPLAPQLSQFGLNLDQIEAQALQQVTRALRTLGGSLLAVLAGSFSGGLTVFFVIILTIFLLTSGEAAWNGIIGWFSPWWRAGAGRAGSGRDGCSGSAVACWSALLLPPTECFSRSAVSAPCSASRQAFRSSPRFCRRIIRTSNGAISSPGPPSSGPSPCSVSAESAAKS